MALKGGDELAACHVPQPQGLVRRATGDGLAVWTVGHAEDLKQAEHESEETFYLSIFLCLGFRPRRKKACLFCSLTPLSALPRDRDRDRDEEGREEEARRRGGRERQGQHKKRCDE